MIQITSRYTGAVIVEIDAPTLKAALEICRANGTVLNDAYLRGADLRGAYLTGAYLRGAYLRGADLRGAYLRGAYLRGADLRGADLTGADLTGAYLRGAKGIILQQHTPLLMLLEQPAAIRAYKLVKSNGHGPQYGGIEYKVGESYEVLDANTDPDVPCAAGINVATLDWCLNEWLTGQRILVVEFQKDDIAAIPNGTDGKFRLHRCKVVREIDLKAELGWPLQNPTEQEDAA